MQKRFGYLAALAGVICTVPTSLADPSSLAPRVAIQADYDRIYFDVRHKDLSSAVRYFAADFMSEDAVNTPGNRTPSMDLTQMRQLASDYSQSNQTITGHAVVQKVIISGSRATATVLHHVMMVGTPDPKTGKRFHGIFDATTQDTWVNGPQGWQMQRGRGLSLRVERHDG